jgi:cation diffusion facilitator family transporter
MICSAGAIILYKVIQNLIRRLQLHQLDFGIWLIAGTAVCKFYYWGFMFHTGKKNNSLALMASGKHLQSDTYSTLGIIAGLALLYYTGYRWVDSAVAILFGAIIIFTGYRILRRSIAGIMDEADVKLLTRMVQVLNANRRENWIDLHNLRVIKYGSKLHFDCHLTVPWYLNVHETHKEIDALSDLIRKEFGDSFELFVHSDGCQPFSCMICNKANCNVRKNNFVQRIDWTLENVSQNKKHELL